MSMIGEQVLPAPAPFVNTEIKQFWDATAEGRLLLPRCQDCQAVIWFPRPFCPECASTRVDWFQASGRGTVYSYTVNRRGGADLPEYRNAGVYVLAYVELEEGPRLMTNIVDCDPESLAVGLPVRVAFRELTEEWSAPVFRPA